MGEVLFAHVYGLMNAIPARFPPPWSIEKTCGVGSDLSQEEIE